jgi:uncharacterized membrane protein
MTGIAMQLTLWLSAGAYAQPYTFTALDLPFPGNYGATCTGINNHGVVVGGYVDAYNYDQGFMRVGNRFILLPLLTTQKLNASRHFTGWYVNNTLFGFLYTGREFLTLHYPESLLTEAIGLNDDDAVVGDYRDRAGYYHAFAYQNGHYTTIDPPFWSSWGCSDESINNAGVIVGNCATQAYIDDHGSFTPLNVPESTYTFARAINNHGGIAGSYCTDASNCHGFIAINGGFSDISVPGATLTEVWGLNDAWEICGRYLDAQGVSHAFVGQPSAAQVAR